jgi:hypothetical protein
MHSACTWGATTDVGVVADVLHKGKDLAAAVISDVHRCV